MKRWDHNKKFGTAMTHNQTTDHNTGHSISQNAYQNTEEFQLDQQEWLESIDYIYASYGQEGVRAILQTLQNHALGRNIAINQATLNTPYRNTIHPAKEPTYPGNIALEQQIENINRWNAMAMVVRAADRGDGVGGHIATYTSAATMMEVGLHHFFRARSDNYGGDLVVFQPHAVPGIYARALLEGRLTRQQLDNFRRELHAGGGLSAYPHPRSMPDFWQVPCASMGLSTPTAIYQARFARYLEKRGLKAAQGGKVWCFIGDGESDEPEVRGTINIAAREQLDNLVLVVNCNLQRLDGPVRGNGKIIQELERSFRGADWNVIKVIWGSGWDALLARDSDGVLQQRMETATDGDYQYLSISPGDVQRELWVENNPELASLMNTLTDAEVKNIKRGGQDHKKIFAAYAQAMQSQGRPTVILIKSVKGDGMGKAGQGRNTAHQKKQLNAEERATFAKHHNIPLSDAAIERADYYLPDEDSEEIRYLKNRRQQLGGYLPTRQVNCRSLNTPPLTAFSEFLNGTGGRSVSTTMAMVRILGMLLKDTDIGRYIVPIVPDEARTFGMDALFKDAGIYAPEGQHYTPVDGDSLLPYREAEDGQILQEGICEAGAMASFMAAGSAYAVHNIPTIPFYIFYSMFGFQRVGDLIWACGDMLCRGFLLGGTAGRTTLNGEGVQHQDGHSLLIASTVPNLKVYDPAFAYELAIIIRDGIERMYQQQQDCFYYITVYNENYPMPAIGDAGETDTGATDNNIAIEKGILRGIYCYQKPCSPAHTLSANILASGSIMTQALAAATLLEKYHVATTLWSVTSYNELYRDAIDCEHHNRFNPEATKTPFITKSLAQTSGVFIAVSDYLKALPNSIAPWLPGPYTVLGTDGYGRSETREALRDYFAIDARHIALAALQTLQQSGGLGTETVDKARNDLGITPMQHPGAIA